MARLDFTRDAVAVKSDGTTQAIGPFYRGDLRSVDMTLRNGTTPVDLTDDTWLCQVREHPAGPVVATLSVYIVGDPEDGQFRLEFSAANGLALCPLSEREPRAYVYDIQRTTLVGIVQTVLHGRLEVVPDVSRS